MKLLEAVYGVVRFYDISTNAGYLMPYLVYSYMLNI